jgi:DNA-binding response OmpR family regulator
MQHKSRNSSFNGRTAIIVAAEAIQALHLHKVLTGVGMQIFGTVTTLEETLPIFERYSPDFVLLDLTILTWGCEETASRVLDGQPSCKILLSHLPEPETRVAAAKWGADGYITKPMDHDLIPARLAEAWSDHRQQPDDHCTIG